MRTGACPKKPALRLLLMFFLRDIMLTHTWLHRLLWRLQLLWQAATIPFSLQSTNSSSAAQSFTSVSTWVIRRTSWPLSVLSCSGLMATSLSGGRICSKIWGQIKNCWYCVQFKSKVKIFHLSWFFCFSLEPFAVSSGASPCVPENSQSVDWVQVLVSPSAFGPVYSKTVHTHQCTFTKDEKQLTSNLPVCLVWYWLFFNREHFICP